VATGAGPFSQRAVIGTVFSLYSAPGKLRFQGDIDAVCNAITNAGEDVATVFQDCRVTARGAAATPLTAIGNRAHAEQLGAMLNTLGDENVSLRDAFAELDRPAREAFARVTAILSSTRVLEEIARNQPAAWAARDEHGMSPIDWAAAFGRGDVVDWMLANRQPFVDDVNRYHWNLADLAKANRREELLPAILQAGARPPDKCLADRIRELGIPIKGETS
jgi:hypothetical protein